MALYLLPFDSQCMGEMIYVFQGQAGLEKSTRPLVFTSASGCRASETFDDFQCKFTFFQYMPIIFVMQGKCLFQDISRPDK